LSACGLLYQFSLSFSLINWAILFFLINRLEQKICSRFKKKEAAKMIGGGKRGRFLKSAADR
jgi:hypothetical protein